MSPTILSSARSAGSSGSVIAFIFTIAIAYACALIAQRKGRSRLIWFILGGLFSFVTLIAVLVIPRRQLREEHERLGHDQGRPGHDTRPAARHTRTVSLPGIAVDGAVDPASDEPNADPLESGMAEEIDAWLQSEPPGKS
jgi:hypothetical protein